MRDARASLLPTPRRQMSIAISFVNPECQEVETRTINPGSKLDMATSEGHAIRIRDAAGATLVDIPPANVDMMTYVKVP